MLQKLQNSWSEIINIFQNPKNHVFGPKMVIFGPRTPKFGILLTNYSTKHMFLKFWKIPKNDHFWILGPFSAILRKRTLRGPRQPDFALTYTIFFRTYFWVFGISRNYMKKEKFWCRLEQNRVTGGRVARVFMKSPKIDPKFKNGHFWWLFENSKNMSFLP